MDPAQEPRTVLPLSALEVAADPPPPTTPTATLQYGTRETDAVRDLHSLDREMTARLSRTFGVSLLAVGALMLALGCLGATRFRLNLPLSVFVLMVPGAVLRSAAGGVRARRRGSSIAILVTALWVALAFGAGVVHIGVDAVGGRAIGAASVLVVVILGVLIGTLVKLIYHDVRLLAAPGTGASREAMMSVEELLAGGAAREHDPYVGVWWLGAVRAITGTLLAVAAVCGVWLMLPHPGRPTPLLGGSPVITALLAPAGIASAVLGGAMALAADRLRQDGEAKEGRWLPPLFVAHRVTTGLGIVLVLAFAASVASAEPDGWRWLGEPAAVVPFLATLGWMACAGFWVPTILTTPRGGRR